MLKNLPVYIRHYRTAIMGTILLTCLASISSPDEIPAGNQGPGNDQVVIERIAPEHLGGHGYKLIYRVNVPISTYWKFKTDFNNTFLISNKFILTHRFIWKNNNFAITETQYTYQPGVFFRWQTHMFPDRFRLEFNLLNSKQCRQKYHYGYIQLEPEGKKTLVTQVAYFDFWGATFWAFNPLKGGMKDFLSYTAKWEQTTAVQFKDRYHEEKNKRK